MKRILIFVFVLVLSAFLVSPVLALSGNAAHAQAGQVAELNAEFLAFLVLITGFLKEQFGLKGKPVLAVAFCVGLFLYYSPLLPINSVVDQIVNFVKWFLAGVGSFDTAVDLFAKIGKKLTQ